MAETLTQPVSHLVETQLGELSLTYTNAVLLRYEDPRENCLEYTDPQNNEINNLTIFEYDFQQLLDEGFGWEYVPTQNDESITIQLSNGKEMELAQRNSRVRTFANPYFNHIEVADGKSNSIMALLALPALYKTLFRLEYPWKHAPLADPDTVEWRKKMAKTK